MKILHRYIFSLLARNFLLSLLATTLLFLLFDFFDRMDNMAASRASVGLVLQYFLFKTPVTISLMFPVAMLVGTLFTFGILAKNSEFTAMRAAGIPISWLARPLIALGLMVSFTAIFLGEVVVPYAAKRTKEIYNIDIKQKDKTGSYSQTNFWWRTRNEFFSVDTFDSRTNSLINLSEFSVSKDFKVELRKDAERATFVDPILGWSMKNVKEYQVDSDTGRTQVTNLRDLANPDIHSTPQEFYDVRADRQTMSYRQLKRFIKKQQASGIPVRSYYADLYEKLSFPFVNLLSALVALPFALKPARSGSMAAGVIGGLAIGYSYYAVHYFSLALGRAELWPPLLAAWMANFVMLMVAFVLNHGAESPH